MSNNRDTINSTLDDFGFSPEVNPFLVKYLKGIYPNKLPRNLIKLNDKELGVLMGQQKVIEHLEALLDEQIQKDTSHVLS